MNNLNASLRQLMAEHKLKRREVSAMLGVSMRTLSGWLAPENSPSHRRLKYAAIVNELETKLGELR